MYESRGLKTIALKSQLASCNKVCIKCNLFCLFSSLPRRLWLLRVSWPSAPMRKPNFTIHLNEHIIPALQTINKVFPLNFFLTKSMQFVCFYSTQWFALDFAVCNTRSIFWEIFFVRSFVRNSDCEGPKIVSSCVSNVKKGKINCLTKLSECLRLFSWY